jgi:predicted amidohydrolase YtcJ
MVILSGDIFAMKPEAIRNVKVETTIVGGRIVYRANAQSSVKAF